jgi:helicase
MTPERLDLCTRDWRSHWAWIPEVDLLIADEFHLRGDARRGARLEGGLLRIRRLNPFLRVLALSATMGNRQELADWLGAVHYESTWRPVPLTWRTVRYAKAEEKPKLACELVRRTCSEGGRSLVFVHSRRRAEALADILRAEGLRAVHHHAGLDRADRQHVESTFRAEQLDVIVATPTLEMGLNLPVRQVVLYDLHQFDGGRFVPLDVNAAWQRGGRAGRPGLDVTGEVVVLAPRWERNLEPYVRGTFEPIRSGLARCAVLAEQVLAEVASGLSRNDRQLARALGQSLAARQHALVAVPDVIAAMTRAGMLVDVAGDDGRRRLKATKVGRVASRHLLAPDTVLLFRRAGELGIDLTFFDLLLVACGATDCEPVLPVDLEDLYELQTRLRCEPSRLLKRGAEVERATGTKGRRLLAALRMALVARDWTRHADRDAIATKHHCYPFEVERLRESIVRLLAAFGEILTAAASQQTTVADRDSEVGLGERIRVLRQMTETGLNEQTVTLTAVDGLGPVTARRLRDVGISDIEALAVAEPEEITAAGRISVSRARRWIKAAAAAVKTHSAFRYVEHTPAASVSAGDATETTDVYRRRRSLDLAVTEIEPGVYSVMGGLEPHLVHATAADLECDCRDAAEGHRCKHMIAVDRFDRALRIPRHRITAPEREELDILALWATSDSSPPRELEDDLWLEQRR